MSTTNPHARPPFRVPRALSLPLLAAALAILSGCAGFVTNRVANAVSKSGDSFASDDDPELVRDAVPFGLKTMEGLLEDTPRHEGLLTALASGFTQYGYAFVQADADQADLDGKLDLARGGRERARKLYLRAREYGVRGLDVRQEQLGARLRAGGAAAREALAKAGKGDVPLLYWTASSWVLAIAANKADMAAVSELPTPVAAMERALVLDEAWNEGALHEFFVAYDATRTAAEGGGPDRVKAHLDRVAALSMNKKLGSRVSFAEGVLVQRQDRDGFVRVLQEVVAADAGAVPRYRLANLIAQRRAKALLAHVDDLFL
jgi:predicted anti-sigma-YlaC factor YlaD